MDQPQHPAQELLGNDLQNAVAQKPFLSLLCAAAVGVALEQSGHLLATFGKNSSKNKISSFANQIALKSTLQGYAFDLLKSAALMYIAQWHSKNNSHSEQTVDMNDLSSSSKRP